ncbi:MAG: DUF6531 domain-containing protein, partial [Defluviitaleaceae bacterium]|nr:DUF6531 domain-containing protein [Defluviitaleaceae bacterium]
MRSAEVLVYGGSIGRAVAVVAVVAVAVALAPVAIKAVAAKAVVKVSAKAIAKSAGKTAKHLALPMGMQVASDAANQENSSLMDYFRIATIEVVAGAIRNPIVGDFVAEIGDFIWANLTGHDRSIEDLVFSLTSSVIRTVTLNSIRTDGRLGNSASGNGTNQNTTEQNNNNNRNRTNQNNNPRPNNNNTTPPRSQPEAQLADPVDAIHGNVFYDITDFEYTGIITFKWERTYNTKNTIHLSPLGYGMSNLYLMHIVENYGAEENDDIIQSYHAFINKEGRQILFYPLSTDEQILIREEKIKISYDGTNYTIFDYNRKEYYTFSKKDNQNNYTLDKIENETKSHNIKLDYENNNLNAITDSVGRKFKVTANQDNLITKIALGDKILIQYGYNEHKDLITLKDVNGSISKIEYKNHLMVKRITKENNTFNWEYDGIDHTAKCIHTWGDSGLLEGFFKYEENYTSYTNSLKQKEIFYFDENKKLTKLVRLGEVLEDPNGFIDETQLRETNKTIYTYTEHGETQSITNPDSEKTSYKYNDLGQVTEITLPSGATQKLDYDEKGKLTKSISPTGLTTEWIYNEQGNISEIRNPNGVLEKHEYNENGLLISITEEIDEIKNITKFSYDNHFNITEITYPNNAIEKFTYDDEGNCTSHINPLGALEKMKYDTANRLIEHTAPDGNITKLKYNAYTDVIYLKDNTKELNFTYTALGSISSRKEQQRITHFKYDTEEQLTQVINEKGEKYIFERNHQGNVTTETGFDNVRKSYTYTPAGKLKGMRRGNTSDWLRMKYDKAGYLSKIIYDNGGEDLEEDIFTHGKLGELLKAESKNSTLAFEYDKFGNIIKEIQNDKEIISEYNSPLYPFARTKLQTSLGLDINTTINEFGQTTEITADFESFTNHYSNIKNSNNNLNSENRLNHLWNIKQTFNPIGQLLERNIQVSPTKVNQTKPTEIKDSWNYNNQGLPTTKTLKTNINNRE